MTRYDKHPDDGVDPITWRTWLAFAIVIALFVGAGMAVREAYT